MRRVGLLWSFLIPALAFALWWWASGTVAEVRGESHRSASGADRATLAAEGAPHTSPVERAPEVEPGDAPIRLIVRDDEGRLVVGASVWIRDHERDWRELSQTSADGEAELPLREGDGDRAWLIVAKNSFVPTPLPLRSVLTADAGTDPFEVTLHPIQRTTILVEDRAGNAVSGAEVKVEFARDRELLGLMSDCPAACVVDYLNELNQQHGHANENGEVTVVVPRGRTGTVSARSLGYLPNELRVEFTDRPVPLQLTPFHFAGIEGVVFADGTALSIDRHLLFGYSGIPIETNFQLQPTEADAIRARLEEVAESMAVGKVHWIWGIEVDPSVYPAQVDVAVSCPFLDLPKQVVELEFRYLQDLQPGAIARIYEPVEQKLDTTEMTIRFCDRYGVSREPVDDWIVAKAGDEILEARGVAAGSLTRKRVSASGTEFVLHVPRGDYEICSEARDRHYSNPRARPEFAPVTFAADRESVLVEVQLDPEPFGDVGDLRVEVVDTTGLEVLSWDYWLLKPAEWSSRNGESESGAHVIDGVTAGDYLLVVVAEGLAKAKQLVHVEAGRETSVSIELSPWRQVGDDEYANEEWIGDANALATRKESGR